ncbi:MAG: CHAT domain-containing protein [Hyphomicrobiaceae bacterium]
MPIRRTKSKRRSRKRTKRSLQAEQKTNESPDFQMSLAEAASLALPEPIIEKLIGSHHEQRLSQSFNRVIILPAADIGTLPFAALPVGDKLLVDHMAIVLLPDIDALMADEIANPIPFVGRRALVVGDPDLSRDRQQIFQPLPAAQQEAIDVGRLTRSAPLLRSFATRKRVLKRLKQRPHLIYFATHGISDSANPMDQSFLALSGGHLYGRDIKRLRSTFYREFVNPVVVMSACQTGLGKVFEGGVFGLARAWHYAGAWQVVMSLWNVNDKATKSLMTRFMQYAVGSTYHRRSWSGHGLSGPLFEAWGERMRLVSPHQQGVEFDLRAASLAMQKKSRDPALWAGFVHYGLPTMQR